MNAKLGAVVLGLAGALLAAPAAAPSVPDSSQTVDAKKRCRIVTRKVRGKKKRVRVCRTTRPRPRPRPTTPSPVRRIDIGGLRLAIECRGTGAPTVVLDSGFSTSRLAWIAVHQRAARTTRVCTYDRAGLGQSNPRPGGSATTARVAEELHLLLAAAGIPPPYVLGGWSIGGFDVRYYAQRYPADVAGIVLVDATPEGWILSRVEEPISSGVETMFIRDAALELASGGLLGSRPLIALTHGRIEIDEASNAEWERFQKEVVRRSSNSILVRANRSGHGIADEQPDLVIEALRLVVEAARSAGALPPCTASPLPALEATCLELNS